MLQFILYGIVYGSILILASVGFFMIRKIENFLNIAHAEMLTLGAYLTYLFNVILGLHIVIAAIIAIMLTALVGLLVAKIVFWPIKGYDSGLLLVTSVGVAFIFNGTVEILFGVKIKSFDIPLARAIKIGGVPTLSSVEFIIIALAILSVLGLHLMLTRTTVGKAVRAMSSNFDLARIRRIDTKRMSAYVWLLSTGLAGMAGISLGLIGKLNSEMGWNFILIILCVTVVGGLASSVYGVMCSAFILGIAMEVSLMVIPSAYRELLAFVLIIIVLFFRPQGLFGRGDTA